MKAKRANTFWLSVVDESEEELRSKKKRIEVDKEDGLRATMKKTTN